MNTTPQDKASLIEKFFENQDKEFEVKMKEIDLASRELDFSAELSIASLQANEKDREQQRCHTQKIWSKGFWLILALIVALLAFGIAALFAGEAELLKSLGVSALISGTSFGAGYGFRWYREFSEEEEE